MFPSPASGYSAHLPPCTVLIACLAVLAVALSACSGGGSSSPLTTPSTPSTPQNPVGPNLIQISSDPYTVGPGQHATEVEPHMIANGSTLVAAFQTGRIPNGGGTDIGWATSADGGNTWTHGFLPGLTTGEGTGPYDAASDPVVAYDARHAIWMIASLPLSATFSTPAVVVSRSTDGLSWQNPVSVNANSPGSDKNWIVCDPWPSSPYYGNCYLEWDDTMNLGQIRMSSSTDGGVTWGPALSAANFAEGIGGQPLVQPNGTVIVPFELFTGSNSSGMAAFSFSDGGASWTAPATISNVQFHGDAGGIRSGALPSAAVDGAGTIWVVWEDCRFRANCSTNDLVYSTSSDGVTWSSVIRIPIDDVSSAVDHFIPGIGIDPGTAGATAHIALHYYYYPQSNCSASTCQLCGIHLLGKWRSELEYTHRANRAHGPCLASKIAKRSDGRRLHRHRLYEWYSARRVCRRAAQLGQHLQGSDVHREGPHSGVFRTPALLSQ